MVTGLGSHLSFGNVQRFKYQSKEEKNRILETNRKVGHYCLGTISQVKSHSGITDLNHYKLNKDGNDTTKESLHGAGEVIIDRKPICPENKRCVIRVKVAERFMRRLLGDLYLGTTENSANPQG
ncbi:MAG TPA: hypothetical protein V6C52_13855 [Coleofasciculaceae cyanobacterium]|jgi:hypothetical protein